MASNPLNFKKNHAEVVAAETAIAPLLVAAGITSLTVEGKEVPASDAPLAAKVIALGKLIATGDKTEDSAAAIKANGELNAQLEAEQAKLVATQATVAAQTQQINDLTGKLNVAQASVATLTAKNTELGTLLKASTDESIRLTSVVAAQKLALAKDCLAWNCVDFKAADGQPLAKNASDADLATAAEKITFVELHTAHKGAVTAAAAKVGVDLNVVPAANPNAQAKLTMKRADFLKLEPKAQTEFFKNKGTLID